VTNIRHSMELKLYYDIKKQVEVVQPIIGKSAPPATFEVRRIRSIVWDLTGILRHRLTLSVYVAVKVGR
jgi:hypothetical protein